MTWEETIRYIRMQPEHSEMVKQSYLDENLSLNVERFKSSAEFLETLKLISQFAPSAKSILDIGAGNGISSIAFALTGYDVTVAEPDQSETVGCGAINVLKKELSISNLKIINSYGEKLPFEDESFDVVYIRQAMHHAANLKEFVMEAARVLKLGGILLTIRDHVIFNEKDKQIFLQSHPLQKYYGGENAFTEGQYAAAMLNAGLKIIRKLRYYDSVINYFPASDEDLENISNRMQENFRESLQERFGSWAVRYPFLKIMELISRFRNGGWNSERRIPGRMYSFISVKDAGSK